MRKEFLEKLLNNLLSTGGDFGEIYEEQTKIKEYLFIDSKLDNITLTNNNGVGIRLVKDSEVYYGSINYNDEDEVLDLTDELKKNISEKVIYHDIKLNEKEIFKPQYEKDFSSVSDGEIKKYLSNLDKKIRSMDKRIIQVKISLNEEEKLITISNHRGLYKSEKRIVTRVTMRANFKDGENTSTASYNWATNKGLETLDKNVIQEIKDMVKRGIDSLYAKECQGKEMPVILGPGFGAVIFHEACGHAMEAYNTSKGASVLSGKIGKKIASDKVTIIDDGTIDGLWGTIQIDDEGNKTRKNVLIKNGVLVNYLNDEISNRKLNMELTGSSRRESYKYAPVSRMNNTYLKPGNDKVEDMIKSIKLGLYAKALGGGSVLPDTGEFNFMCDTAYMIRDGKIAECVKGASLIGDALDILKNVEMVSDNLEYAPGICGASSGNIPVTVGQPTIKVSNILVGGASDDK